MNDYLSEYISKKKYEILNKELVYDDDLIEEMLNNSGALQ